MSRMWKLSVRTERHEGWQAIWSGAGPDAEADARSQFSRVSARVDGIVGARENIHAEEWTAVQLESPDGDLFVHDRTQRGALVSTVPPRS